LAQQCLQVGAVDQSGDPDAPLAGAAGAGPCAALALAGVNSGLGCICR
jgi:hypothetical protein